MSRFPVHAVRGSIAICGFSKARVDNAQWPSGHLWCYDTQETEITCLACKKKLEEEKAENKAKKEQKRRSPAQT